MATTIDDAAFALQAFPELASMSRIQRVEFLAGRLARLLEQATGRGDR